jgi:hypothetical protein
MSASRVQPKNSFPFSPAFILSSGITLEKVRRLRNYYMATHRSLVKDIMVFVVHQAVHERLALYFDEDGHPKENADLQFQNDFLEIYCEDPPRPRFPNVNARIRLRQIITMFNRTKNCEDFRIYWIGTPVYIDTEEPLRIRTPEEFAPEELMFNFDFYWGLVLMFVDARRRGEDVTTWDVRKEVMEYGSFMRDPKADLEKPPLLSQGPEEEVSPTLLLTGLPSPPTNETHVPISPFAQP